MPGLGEWADLPPLEEPVLPKLPARSGEGDWTPEARATWESWRQDPVTTQWTPADTNFALHSLYLADACARRVRSSFAAEVRLRCDALGLTPKGKRALRWRIVADPGDVVEHPTASRRIRDRKHRLRAVDPMPNKGGPNE